MKFSEIALFTIENFLKDLFYKASADPDVFVAQKSYFKGPRKTLSSSTQEQFTAYVKKSEGYKKLTLKVNDSQWNTRTEENKDIIYIDIKDGDYYTAQQTTPSKKWKFTDLPLDGFTPVWVNVKKSPTETLPTEKIIITNTYIEVDLLSEDTGYIEYGFVDNEDEIYFRKNEEFYQWIQNTTNSTDALVKDQIEYLNINKPFLFVGRVYKISADYSQSWNLEHYGMKNFVINGLPDHDKTEGISTWFRYFFDRVYQKGYYAVQNINTLIDPDECPAAQLPYLAKYSNLNINNYNLDELTTRSLIKSHVNLLKRKGTYYALIELWNLIVPNSNNSMKIFDRWISKRVLDDKLNPSEYFVDYEWRDYYTFLKPYLMIYSNVQYLMNDGLTWSLTYNVTLDKNFSNREIQKMETPSAHWLVYTENDYEYEPLISVYDLNFKKIKPKNISRVAKNFFKIYISDEVDLAGYVFITKTHFKE